jgi:hypothetical protein
MHNLFRGRVTHDGQRNSVWIFYFRYYPLLRLGVPLLARLRFTLPQRAREIRGPFQKEGAPFLRGGDIKPVFCNSRIGYLYQRERRNKDERERCC